MALSEWQKERVAWSRYRFFFNKRGISIANRLVSSSLPMRRRLMRQIVREAKSPAETWRMRGWLE